MKPRHKRMIWLGAGAVAIAVAATLVLNAFRSNLVFFHTPTEVSEGKVPKGKNFRIGGLVEPDSVRRDADGITVTFRVTDGPKSVDVVFKGILPDLFKEGKGMVAQGVIDPDGRFRATEVLAKHDENYMPPEAAEALKRSGHPAGTQPNFADQAAKTVKQ